MAAFRSSLNSYHLYFIKVINSVIDIQCAEGVELHLRIFFRLHQNALSVLEVNDVELLV